LFAIYTKGVHEAVFGGYVIIFRENSFEDYQERKKI
jgi:hypothetical protein